VIASWEGPIVDTRDLHVDALYGDRFLRDIQPGSNVRVSVGWRSPDGFEPFAVGSEVTAPRAVPVEPIAQEVARWEPEPVEEARFQSRRIESVSMAPPPYAARLASTPAPEVAAAAAAAFVERARVVSDRGGPVDTGVAVWGPPPADTTLPPPQQAEAIFANEAMPPYESMPPYEEFDEEATTGDAWEDPPTPGEASPGWFESGGSSELGRGGSSELGRGGQGRRLRPGRGRRLVPSVPGRPSPAAVPGWPAGAPAPLLAPAAPRGAPGAAAALGGASELSPGGASELSF
jgi:hypothetical protein